MKITIYDKPTTIDRYTVVIERDDKTIDFYAMSTTAEGFNQFCGTNEDGYKKGKHLGKRVDFDNLSLLVRKAIICRIMGE
jgi:hypothetical protein